MIDKPTIASLRQRFIAGDYTPVDALADALAVIKERDKQIHAFHEVFATAEEMARLATERFKKEGAVSYTHLTLPTIYSV